MSIQPLRDIDAAGNKPNIVLIVLDTMRVKNMHCYGYPKPTTPFLDKLAGEGTLFENHFVPGCWTLPSHVSMFTGLYPCTHRADMEHAYLDNTFSTWAEICHALGYRTAAFNPNTWIRAAAADRGFLLVDSCQAPADYEHGSRFAADRFARWLADYRNDGTPFFAFLNFGDPHLPCQPPEPYLSDFLPGGVSPEDALAMSQDPHKPMSGERTWSAKDWEILEALNDGGVATADARAGAVYETLSEEGRLDDTLFIVISDHGDVYNEHPPIMAHVMNVYDSCIHTPLIMRYPDTFDGGQRVPALVQATDLLPTFLEMIGVNTDTPALAGIQGKSLIRALDGEVRDFIYAEDPFPWNEMERYKSYNPAFDGRPYYRFLRTVRDHDYKYIYSSRGDDELYRIRDDQDEQRNLITTETEISVRIRQDLELWLKTLPVRDVLPALNTSPIKPVTEASLERMQLWRGAPPPRNSTGQ